MRFLVRLILNGLAIIIAAWLLPGILGFVNAIVRPVLFFLTLPLTLLTLGLFIFVLNAICFGLTAWLVPGFSIDGFFSALFGALLVTVVSWILNGLVVGRRERD
jgi:putative membrane protein